MQNDLEVLKQLNVQIGNLESKGDQEAYNKLADDIIAPKLAFRRASGKIDSREDFLNSVTSSVKRETEVESIHLYGERAVVTCVVTMKSADAEKKYHNLRLFVRHEGKWKLLGWANQEL